MASQRQPSAPSRRRFLRAGLGVTLSAIITTTGCSLTDPRIDDSDRTPRPVPTPTPLPGTQKAADQERALAAGAAAILADADRDDLSSAQLAALEQLVTGHREHAHALLSPDPTAGPRSTASPSPDPSPSEPPGDLSPGAAVKKLRALENQQYATYLDFTIKTSGYTSLLWASMAAAALAYAGALSGNVTPADPTPPDEPAALTPVTDVEAVQELLRQTHAIIYGYQLAIGRLSGDERERASGRLLELRRQRDDLTATLTDRQAAVPVAEPAYKTSPKINNSAKAIGLLRSMESALLPYSGQVVSGSADASTRGQGATALVNGSAAAQGWGASLPSWPGWPA